MQSEQINELAAALAKAQTAMTNAVFNRINPHFKSKYADLPAVIEAVRPALAANGLSVTQETRVTDTGFVLATVLRHASGQWTEATYPLPANGKPQEMGSALTYARRYSLAAICGIASDDDDDGERTSGRGKDPRPINVKPVATEPRRIDVPIGKDGKGADWGSWGKFFVDAINSAPDAATFQAWCDLNADPIKNMAVTEPKMARALADRIAAGKAKWLEAA